MPESTTKFNIINVAAWLLSIGLLLVLIIVGKSYLVPIFMALVIWYLVNALSQLFQSIPLVGKYLPDSVTLIMSLFFIGLALYQVGDVLVGTIQGFVEDSQKYLPRIEAQIAKVVALLQPDAPPYKLNTTDLYDRVLLNWAEVLASLGNFAKGLFLVLLYVLFFIIGQHDQRRLQQDHQSRPTPVRQPPNPAR